MKFIIENNNLVASNAELTGIDISSYTGGELKYVELTHKFYEFQPNLTKELAEDLSPDVGGGLWVLNEELYKIIQVKPNSYNASINDDLNITNLTNLGIHGPSLIGSAYGIMDWKCLRDAILFQITELAGTDLENFETNLTSYEKELAKIYAITYLVGKKGDAYTVMLFEGSTVEEKMFNFNSAIDNYLDQTQGNKEKSLEGAYWKRWRALVKYFYAQLGDSEGLYLSSIARKIGVRHLYTSFGAKRKSEDAAKNSCFVDWVKSEEGFTATSSDPEEAGVKNYFLEVDVSESPNILIVDPTAEIKVKKVGTALDTAIDDFISGLLPIIDEGLYY